MFMDPFVRTPEERIALVRKNLIDSESRVKEGRSRILDALRMVDGLAIVSDKDKWELVYHLYSAVEACDKALEIVFDKEYDMDSYRKENADDWQPWTKDVTYQTKWKN